MRDRLIKLTKRAQNEWLDKEYEHETHKDLAEYVADYLLAEGIIVPPCKVGDTAYSVIVKSNHINSAKVVGFHLGKFPTLRGSKRKEYLVCYSGYCLRHIDIDKIGKTVFLTREEAERALERSKNGTN